MSILEHLQLMLEASALGKNFFEQKYKNSPNYNKVNELVNKEFTNKLQVMIVNDKIKQMTINFLKFIGYQNGNVSQVTDLIHDIISDFGINIYSQKYINLMKDSDSKLETIQDLYNKMKDEKNKKTNDENMWKIVENSYVELPNQNEVRIENFNGTGKEKVYPITNGYKWFIGTAIPEEELKNSELYNNLNQSDIKALTVASKKGELLVRKACPLDAKKSGHCGAVPYVDYYQEAIFLMLKKDKSSKSVASVFVDDNGNILESKGNFNTSVPEEFHINMIWLLNHEWINGTSWGGYAPDKNFFLYKLKDKELANHFYNSGKNITDKDKKIQELKDEFERGKLSISRLYDMLFNIEGITLVEMRSIMGDKKFNEFLTEKIINDLVIKNIVFGQFVSVDNKLANSYEVQSKYYEHGRFEEVINLVNESNGVLKINDKIQNNIDEEFWNKWLEENESFINKNDDGSIDVDKSVDIRGSNISKIIPKFNKVKGSFSIIRNFLTSLENCPKEVVGNFNCSNNKLTSLEGCPEIVRDSFNCKDNQLESLRFIPEKIDGSLNCSINKLTSLENCPKVINGNFECYDNQLKSLKGCPNVIGGSFNCSYNPLETLKGGPKIVHGGFFCMSTNIKSLEGAPEKIVADIKLFDNKKLNDDEVDEYVKKHKFGGKLYKINNESFSSFYYGKIINE